MSDEWIKHDGGPCPVPPETWVQIKDGNALSSVSRADDWNWRFVSAYRIFAPVSATPPADADEAFIRDTAARVLAGLALRDDWQDYTNEQSANQAITAAEALAAKLKERKA